MATLGVCLTLKHFCACGQTADFGPNTALKVVDAIRDDIRSGRVKTRNDVRCDRDAPGCRIAGLVRTILQVSAWTMCTVMDLVLPFCRARLKQSIVDVLTVSGKSSDLEFPDAKPAVLLIVGVNGGGKTTTIGKLAHKYGSEGVKVISFCPLKT